jgi:hypothetical protein
MNDGIPAITVSEPSIFRIRVRGVLDASWSDYLGDMALSAEREGESVTITTLIGPLADQSALLGVLNAIHDLGLPLLSVEQISGKPFSG